MIASGQEIRQHVNNFQSVISEIAYVEGMGGGGGRDQNVILAGCGGLVIFQMLKCFCQMLSLPGISAGQKSEVVPSAGASILQPEQSQWSYADLEKPRIWPSVVMNNLS